MPTYELPDSVYAEYAKLSREQRRAFRRALARFIEALCNQPTMFPGGLRVKGVQGHPGVFEMTFAPDGRATFEYAAPLSNRGATIGGADRRVEAGDDAAHQAKALASDRCCRRRVRSWRSRLPIRGRSRLPIRGGSSAGRCRCAFPTRSAGKQPTDLLGLVGEDRGPAAPDHSQHRLRLPLRCRLFLTSGEGSADYSGSHQQASQGGEDESLLHPRERCGVWPPQAARAG